MYGLRGQERLEERRKGGCRSREHPDREPGQAVFLVCVKDILIGVAQSVAVGNGWDFGLAAAGQVRRCCRRGVDDSEKLALLIRTTSCRVLSVLALKTSISTIRILTQYDQLLFGQIFPFGGIVEHGHPDRLLLSIFTAWPK